MRPATAEAPGAAGRLRLTGEGLAFFVAAAVLAGVGWFKSLNLVLVLAYFMLALLVLNGILARMHARRVTALRQPVDPVSAGEETRVRVTVANPSLWPASVEVVDETGEPAIGWVLDQLLPGAAVECREERTFPRRGRMPTPPPRISSAFPFGLLQFDCVGEGDAEIVVLPAAGRADAAGLRRWVLRQSAGEVRSRQMNRRATSDHADVRGVRPYRAGDSLRAVHWRTSARRGELMVREYDATPAPELILVVEPWLPAESTAADRDRLEAALSLATTVARTWFAEIDSRVTLVVAGGPTTMPIGPSEAALRAVLAPLAEVTGAPSFPAFGPGSFGRSYRSAARVVVSSRPHSGLAAGLGRSTGKPFASLDASQLPPWYQPPGKG